MAWYLTDRLGSVSVLTDATGAVIDRIFYDGFGNILSETNPSDSDRYLFTGREFDRVTGLQYNRARYYDPTTGRWTSEDPLGSRRATRILPVRRQQPHRSSGPERRERLGAPGDLERSLHGRGQGPVVPPGQGRVALKDEHEMSAVGKDFTDDRNINVEVKDGHMIDQARA